MSAEQDNSRSAGHCMTMGTASTMASFAESIGIALHSNAAIPAVDSRRYVLAQMAGRRIVDMVKQDITMSSLLKRENFENAIMVNGAIGGSTNAVVHMLAIAGRMGIDITLDDWDRLGRDVPCLVNLMPSGKYLMEDFFYAGGLPAVVRELGDYLHKDAMTANGNTLWENCKDAECYNRDVIFPLDKPFKPNGGIAVLRGNLAPGGAIYFGRDEENVKRLMTHPGILIGSDGIPMNRHPHPRLWGTFPRVLGHYARDLGLMEMEDAIHRMTAASADRFGLKGRGRIEVGAAADLIVFDPATIIDKADFMNPEQPADGIDHVFVNGTEVWNRQGHTGAAPGRVVGGRAA